MSAHLSRELRAKLLTELRTHEWFTLKRISLRHKVSRRTLARLRDELVQSGALAHFEPRHILSQTEAPARADDAPMTTKVEDLEVRVAALEDCCQRLIGILERTLDALDSHRSNLMHLLHRDSPVGAEQQLDDDSIDPIKH